MTHEEQAKRSFEKELKFWKTYGMAQPLSEVFGIKKESLRSQLQEDGMRKLIVCYLDKFPHTVYIGGLRKLKSRAMVEALQKGLYEKVNHKIVYNKRVFAYYYRGTPIYLWNAYTDKETSIHAGQYEDTESTRNQRKEIRKSIQEFKEAVLKL